MGAGPELQFTLEISIPGDIVLVGLMAMARYRNYLSITASSDLIMAANIFVACGESYFSIVIGRMDVG